MAKQATKEKELEDVIRASQPKFLEAVKETYYLAVLGSLCIAVSAFTQQTYPQAQAYAITGATLFLVAFVCSFVAKFFPSSTTIIPSYLSTIGGVLMLFLVAVDFFNSIAMVSKALSLIVFGVISVIVATIPITFYQQRKNSKGKLKLILTIAVVALSIMVSSMILMLTLLTLSPISTAVLGGCIVISIAVFSISGILGLALTLVAIPLLVIEKRQRGKEKRANVTVINEGSGL
jgi:hypothetical protein